MVRVAVAGGTGAVGKTFVEVLLKSQKHQVFVLTRKLPAEDARQPGLSYLQARYDSIEATTKTLEENDIDTVISAISIESEVTSMSQINLIKAADRAKTTTRFMPSEYGFIATPELVKMDILFQFWIDNAEAIRKTSLKYTRIVNGFFMDYWGVPHLKSNLEPFPWAIVVELGKAAIPGTGDDILSMTYSYDLAEFILKMLDVDDWPEFSKLSGQDVSFNQLLRWAEDARGIKFQVEYDDEKTLIAGKPTLLQGTERDEMVRSLTTLFGLMTISGHFRMPNERDNDRFPDLRLKRVDDMIKDAWSKEGTSS